MLELVIAQLPPVPTLLPVPTAPISIPEFGLWDSTDEIVQLWQVNSAVTTGFQHLLIVALVAGALFMIIFLINKTRHENE